MKKKIAVSVLVVFVFSTIFSYWAGYSLGRDKDSAYKELDVFAEALATVEKQYVEDKKPHDLIYGALRGVMNSLDSYSQFLDPDEYKELLTETEGEFGGLGVEITIKDGLLTVVTAMEDAPAAAAGMESGDIIVKIEDELTRGITLAEAVKKLRGDPGTKVELVVLKEKQRILKNITVTRGIIKIKDIKRAMVLDGGIGYLKIAEFRENTAKDLDKALADFKAKKIKGLIVDVRNNPGGLLYSAIEVSSRFLPENKTVVSTKTRGKEEKIYKSSSGGVKITDVPMVVLINQGSASGSEILAGALRENNRAVLLGETTFGKGSVQTILPLSDGSALRLTTSIYYTPDGISIHEKGIKPDVEVEEAAIEVKATAADKEKEVFDKLKKESQADKDVSKFDYRQDNQIVRALDLIKGLTVLSGSR